jgi:hypothetical protein
VNPEDGGNTFHINIGEPLLDYTTSHPKRQYFSVIMLIGKVKGKRPLARASNKREIIKSYF